MNASMPLTVLVVASMLALAASAPLSDAGGRRVRQAASTPNVTLSDVASGLEVLLNLSVNDLMHKLDLRTIVTGANIFHSNYTELVAALNTTCDLQHAKDHLIPNITDEYNIVQPIVEQLNTANIKDACLWLSDTITKYSSTAQPNINCSSSTTTSSMITPKDICRRWNGIRKYKSTLHSVTNLARTPVTPDSCGWINSRIEGQNAKDSIRAIACRE